MTVDQLIQELEKLPKHMPVMVLTDQEPQSVHMLEDDGSRDAGSVKHMGSYILIESR